MSSDKNSWTVYEGESTVSDKINEPDVKVGDTIHYATNNQQGARTYEVVLKNGKKGLKLISSYEMEMAKFDNDDDYSGGKKRNKKTKSKKSKKSKSKRTRSKRTKK